MLNRPGDVGFNDNFYNECIQEKDDLEQCNLDITPQLNLPITLEEIQIFVSKLKSRKATGIDRIPNEVLKQEDMVNLYKLFIKLFFVSYFAYSMVKSYFYTNSKEFNKSLICTIKLQGNLFVM